MVNFHKDDFIQQAIQSYHPQTHGKKWTKEEEKIIHECIKKGLSLEDISRIIKNRSQSAIYRKANSLGYGYKKNDDGLTYFHTEINHKNRRTNDEIIKEREKVPIGSENSIDTNIKITDNIILKVEISVTDLHMSITLLTRAKDNSNPDRRRSNGGSLDDLTDTLLTKDTHVS